MNTVSVETQDANWFYGPYNNVQHYFKRVTTTQYESLCKLEFVAFTTMTKAPKQPDETEAGRPVKCITCYSKFINTREVETIQIAVAGEHVREFSERLGALLECDALQLTINGRNREYSDGKDSILDNINRHGLFPGMRKPIIEITTIDNQEENTNGKTTRS